MTLTPGTRLAQYEVLGRLGAGGMGEVFRARDLRLGREVAIKVLPREVADDPQRRSRLEREARSASSLNHPNLVTIHEIGDHEGIAYIAMELVPGRTLAELIAEGPLDADRAADLVRQAASGLAAAHASGVIHRDIKPANLMVTPDGRVKVLDFGLARPLAVAGGDDRSRHSATAESGLIVGTPHYLSPEQCAGGEADHRSDQFALGIVLYESLAGSPPFDGPSVAAILGAILSRDPPALRSVRRGVPPTLDRITSRCLAKDPADRYPTTDALVAALDQFREERARRRFGLVAALRRPRVGAALGTVVLAASSFAVVHARGADARWAATEAPAEITGLIESGEIYEAHRRARRAARLRPGDRHLRETIERISLPVVVNSMPSGAEVRVKSYTDPSSEWELLGTTPLPLKMPYALMRWRVTLAGHEPFEGAPFSGPAIQTLAQGLPLDPIGTAPVGMVRVPGGVLRELSGARPREELPVVSLASYHLDRFEVTNRQFRAFVDSGGYRSPEYWPPMRDSAGSRVAWERGVAAFRDRSGRPGPAEWLLGEYAAGTDEHPVSGISWYEAAAYCAFVGKSLPTVYHWFHALGQDQLSDIVRMSNMDGDSTAPVGAFSGLGAFGTYDMAGNVREWAWNATEGARYLLGGAWNEPTYLFRHLVALDPMDRGPTNGVRCAKYPDPPPAALLAEVTPRRTYERPDPLGADAFAALSGIYAFDRTPLDAVVVAVNDSLPGYRRETVEFRTAYGVERMQVHLLIPRHVAPPYQAVLWFPGDDVFLRRSSADFASAYLFDFIPRGGRVLVHPVYESMYERWQPWERSPSGTRDRVVRWQQDIARTLDYLATRGDFDPARVAYYGFSLGAIHGPVFAATEPRIRSVILLGGGLVPLSFRPEVHPVHFAPRVRAPTLMINGVDDFLMPYDLAQRPLLELFGTPAEHKRHARLVGGHIPANRLDIVREVLDWLDRTLGPVRADPELPPARDR